MNVLNILFSQEERDMIRRAAMIEWERRHPPAARVVPADQNYLTQDLWWDHNNEVHRIHMQDLRELIITGIRNAVPKPKNIKLQFVTNA